MAQQAVVVAQLVVLLVQQLVAAASEEEPRNECGGGLPAQVPVVEERPAALGPSPLEESPVPRLW